MRKRATPTPNTFSAAFRSPQVIASIAAPLALVGANYFQDRRRMRQDVEDKAQSYRDMMSYHPHFQHKDQAEIGRIFNSLHRASPSMAKDPMVAGAWVDNILENKTPGMNSHQGVLNAVKDLSAIEKNVTDSARNRAIQQHDRWGNILAGALKDVASEVTQASRNDLDAQAQKATEELNARQQAINKAEEYVKEQGRRVNEDYNQKSLRLERKEFLHKQRQGGLRQDLRGMVDEIRNRQKNMEEYRSPLQGSHFGSNLHPDQLHRYPPTSGLGRALGESPGRPIPPVQSSMVRNFLFGQPHGEMPPSSGAPESAGRPFVRTKKSSYEPSLRDHFAALRI